VVPGHTWPRAQTFSVTRRPLTVNKTVDVPSCSLVTVTNVFTAVNSDNASAASRRFAVLSPVAVLSVREPDGFVRGFEGSL